MKETQLPAFRKQLKEAAEKLGMSPEGDHAFEKYIWNFATVQISYNFWDQRISVERFYDNEMLSDRNMHRDFPIDGGLETPIRMAAELIKTIKSDEPILNFGEI